MTREEISQIRTMLRKSPRSIWGYWPYISPVLIAIAVAVSIVGLVIYWETKMPDLEVLFRRGTNLAAIADSQLIRKTVMAMAILIAITFVLLAFLARLAFRQVCLLRVAAMDLGIEGRHDGMLDGSQPIRSEPNRWPSAPDSDR